MLKKELGEYIKACKLFQPLSEEGYQFLSAHFTTVEFQRGEIIFQHGEVPNAFYIIVEGRVLLTAPAASGELEIIKNLSEGALVGEVGVLTRQIRTLTAQALNAVKLLKITKADYQTFRDKYAPSDDMATLVKTCKLFAVLSDDEYTRLVSEFEKVRLVENEILFYQGEPSEGLFVVIHGRLLASLATASGIDKIVGTVERGETVGELGALSGQPRSLTIKAMSDCTLLKLSTEDFKNYCSRHPAILFEMVDALIARSQKTISLLSERKSRRHIAVVAANPTVPLDQFMIKLSKFGQSFSDVIIFDDRHHKDKYEIVRLISEASNKKQTILYVLHEQHSLLTDICHEYIDDVYIVAKFDAEPHFSGLALEFMDERVQLDLRRELVLLHDETTTVISETKRWLDKANFSLHHHMRENKVGDYQRLLRFMTGRAVGLVLGGGGARAWAEVGVIKALMEANIPIDAVGGTSAGAIVGSCYALQENYDVMVEHVGKIVAATYPAFSLKNFTWPIISLLSSKSGTQILRTLFAKVQIEDLWIPYFCISCNLNQKREVVHREGYLWEKLRRSASLPGIIPPVVKNGQLYMDGGLVNAVPTDVMRSILGHTNRVIAVNLSNLDGDSNLYNFPLIMGFKNTLLYKLGLGNRHYKFPRFFDTFINALQMGASSKERVNSLTADLLINPDLKNFSMLNLNLKHANTLIEIGYETTKKQLIKWKQE